MSEEREFTFNRRRVVDQECVVQARSYQEALAKMRLGHVDDTCDEVTVSMTVRSLGEQPA